MRTRVFSSVPAVKPLLVKAALCSLRPAWLSRRRQADASGTSAVLAKQVHTDPDHLAAYNALCGFGVSRTLPVTYPHVVAFGLQLAVMTDQAFGFRPAGLVHLQNSITQHRRITSDDAYDIRVQTDDVRSHPKGRLIDLKTDLIVDGDTCWSEITTLLARGRGSGAESHRSPLSLVEAPSGEIKWRLDSDLGRRYARISDDYNPIHLHAVSARLFGFRGAIAHGMWSLARSLAAIEHLLPAACTVDAEFRHPVVLPTTVTMGSQPAGDDLIFGIRNGDGDVTHLVGQVRA